MLLKYAKQTCENALAQISCEFIVINAPVINICTSYSRCLYDTIPYVRTLRNVCKQHELGNTYKAIKQHWKRNTSNIIHSLIFISHALEYINITVVGVLFTKLNNYNLQSYQLVQGYFWTQWHWSGFLFQVFSAFPCYPSFHHSSIRGCHQTLAVSKQHINILRLYTVDLSVARQLDGHSARR
jgi:hypothetical protein